MKYAFVFLTVMVCAATTLLGQNSREVKKSVELSKDGRVYIDTYKGSIDIQTWDKPEVDIVARIESDGWSKRDKEAVDNTEIDIDASSNLVRIKSDYDRVKQRKSWFFGWFEDGTTSLPLVHYTISMPKTARLSIKDYKSDSHISELHAAVDVNTYKGTVEMTGLDGSIDLETYKGKVNIDIAKLTDDSRFDSYKGDIRIALPKESPFELDTDLGRRVDFSSDFDAVYHSKRYSKSQSYRGMVNGGGPLLRLSSEKGTIRLRER